MKQKKIIALLLIAAMATALFSGCSSKEDTVVIGYIGDLSGADAYVGIPPQLFLQDYFAKVNENGGLLGKKVKLVAYDMQPDNAVDGVNACNRLISQDHAIAILGPSSSSAAIPMASICDEAKVPFIATSATNEKVTVAEDGKLHPYAFRVCFIDSYQGTAAAKYAFNDGCRKVGLIETLSNPYSQNICNYFEEAFTALGGEIADRIGIQAEDVEFRAQLTNFAKMGVDTLFVPSGTYKQPAYIANQAKDLGLDFQFIFTDGVYDDTLLEVAGPAVEGCMMTNVIYGNNPEYAAFAAEHNAKHPDWPANIFVYLAYDAVELLMYGIRTSNSLDSVKIRDAIEAANDVALFTDKHFTVDKETHNPKDKMVAIIEVKDGKYNLRDTFYPSMMD